MYNDVFKTNQNIRRKFFFHRSVWSRFINSDRQKDDRYCPHWFILKLSYFGKSDSWKIKVLQIFGSWDEEIDSWLTNNEPLIPTLFFPESWRPIAVTGIKYDLN